ncbi:MAG: hypothetical protein AAFS10_24870, partial [Myxococcota bacterium]
THVQSTNRAWKADLIETTTGAKWGEVTIEKGSDGKALGHVGPKLSLDPSKAVKGDNTPVNLQHGGRFTWTRAALDLVVEMYQRHPAINGGKAPEQMGGDLVKLNLTKFQEAYGRLALSGRNMRSQADLLEAFKATPAYKGRMDSTGQHKVTWTHHDIRPGREMVTLSVDGKKVQVPSAVRVTSSRKPQNQASAAGGSPFTPMSRNTSSGSGPFTPMHRNTSPNPGKTTRGGTAKAPDKTPRPTADASQAIASGTQRAADLDFVNAATAADLAKVPGIHAEQAKALVTARTKQPGGRFTDPTALTQAARKMGPGVAYRLLNYSRLPADAARSLGGDKVLARTIHANELAVALKTHARLPEPFITLKQATALGFPGKPLAEIAPGKAIGGDDVTAQVKGHLPMIEGRTWTSADVGVDYTRPGRKGLRLLFSNDGLLYIAPESLKPAQPFGRYKSAGRALAGRSSGKVAPSRTSLPQETPASSKQVGEMLKGLADAPKLRQEMAAKMVLHYTARTLGVSVGPKGPLEGIAIRYNPKLAEGGQFIVTGKAGQRQGTIVIGPHTTMRALLEEIVHAIDFNRSIRTSKASKPVGSFVAQHY